MSAIIHTGCIVAYIGINRWPAGRVLYSDLFLWVTTQVLNKTLHNIGIKKKRYTGLFWGRGKGDILSTLKSLSPYVKPQQWTCAKSAVVINRRLKSCSFYMLENLGLPPLNFPSRTITVYIILYRYKLYSWGCAILFST